MDYNEKARVLCKKIQEIRSLEDLTNPETFKHDFPLALEFGLSNLTKIGTVVAQVLGEKQKRVFTAMESTERKQHSFDMLVEIELLAQ